MKTLRGSTLHPVPRRGSRASMSHVAQSFLRGLLVAAFVLLPAMLLPAISQDVAQAATLIALISAAVVNGRICSCLSGVDRVFGGCQALQPFAFRYVGLRLFLRWPCCSAGLKSGDGGALGRQPALWLAAAFDFSFSPVRLFGLCPCHRACRSRHLLNVMASAALAFVMCFFWPSWCLLARWQRGIGPRRAAPSMSGITAQFCPDQRGRTSCSGWNGMRRLRFVLGACSAILAARCCCIFPACWCSPSRLKVGV